MGPYYKGHLRKEFLMPLGEEPTMYEEGVTRGANDTMFGKKRRFGKLVVGNKKDKETKWR